jgi:hypothetical protein
MRPHAAKLAPPPPFQLLGLVSSQQLGRRPIARSLLARLMALLAPPMDFSLLAIDCRRSTRSHRYAVHAVTMLRAAPGPGWT